MARYRRYKYRKPHRHGRRKSIFKKRSFWTSLLALAALFGALYLVIFSDIFQVEHLRIEGQSQLAPEIEKLVQGGLEKKFLLFGTKSIFLVNSGRLKEIVLEKFPQVGELQIKKTFPNVLNLALAERREAAVFCAETQCFLLDAEGVIFAPAFESSLPKVRNLRESREPALGDKVVDKETIDVVLRLRENLESNAGVFAEEFSLVSEDRLNVKTTEGWEIYFNLQKSLSEQVAALSALLQERFTPEKRQQLEYIDLRFDRIFVYPARNP